MVTNKNIDKIMKILYQEAKNLKPPVIERVYKKYKSPFYVLIATVLSARTKDETTHKVSINLFNYIKSPEDLIKISYEKLCNLIYPVGFYKTKAKNLKKLGEELIKEFSGKVPDTIEELIKLPGVGRKTANLVITEVFDKYGICVDTHVHRITNRWGYIKTKTPFESEMKLREILPKKYWKDINRLLVTYGQNICKPLNPQCNKCKINKYCEYYSNLVKKE